MTKVVINKCFGGFGLSKKALSAYKELSGLNIKHDCEIYRADPYLIQVVEEMGEYSWGNYAELKIIEIPDDVEWEICEYDGLEHVAEVHRKWS